MYLKVDSKLVWVKVEDIFYVEGMKEYVCVVCVDEKLVIFECLKNIEVMLFIKDFMWVYKLYIVVN